MSRTPRQGATKIPSAQPLSPLAYAFIALAGLAVGVALLVFFISQVPHLAGTVQNRVFYLLLIPWGLACAAFLFGAMKSYASLTHHQFGNAVELGGPIVVFCLVVLGGFRLVPQTSSPFELEVRPTGVGDTAQLITSGTILADWGSYRSSETIDPDGLAHFRGLDPALSGDPVRLLPQVQGYRSIWVTCKPVSNVCDLRLEPSPAPQSHVQGIIENAPGDPSQLLVRIIGPHGSSEGHPDGTGTFDIPITATIGDSFDIQIFSGTRNLLDYTETLGGYGNVLRLRLH
ncbi:MAG: hypothetical protein JO097_08505 [Acidobacteriaceae bacterium]|nr:hypothetical protein [Acidobacteriaceae bacterium]MBV9294526.1 hypothetical protein [Acidobacteriaceae bacterium]MBV9764569.1 hypothetical protein [Acidobacteriaceae bacterium]